MIQCYIYARVSTEEQAKEGQSVETQLRLCRKYANDNNIKVAEVFVDEGKSATNMNRPALQDMLGNCQDKSNQVSVILVQDTDRLARNTLDHLNIKAILKKRDVKLISISQPGIDDSAEGDLIDTILAATNTFQSKITGRKTSKVLEQKAEIGWYPGGTPPLGYRNADNLKPSTTLDRRIVVVDDEVSPHVIEIFKRYAEGNTSASALAKYLNNHGIRSPQAKAKIHASLVNRMLQDKFYIGKFEWKKKSYTGKHKLFISKTLFKQAQTMLETNNHGATRKRKHNMLLRGLLFYQETDSQMWGEVRVKDGKEYQYYYCKKKGKGSYITASTIESQVEKIFKKIEISDGYKQEVMNTAKELLKESRSTREEERERLLRERTKLKKAISEAEDDRYITHIITSEALMQILEKYKPLLAKVDEDLAGLDVDHGERLKSLERILTLAENIGEAYRMASPQLRHEYLAIFFKKFFVKNGKIVKYVLAPDLKDLIEAGSVRVRTTGLPLVDLFANRKIVIDVKISAPDQNQMFEFLAI